jgi:membrane fusion protein, multidrug efflux system
MTICEYSKRKPESRTIVLSAWFLSFTVLIFTLTATALAQTPPPTPVRVAPVVEKTVAAQISLIGSTEAVKSSVVASEVQGIVEKFPVNAGDLVNKGDTLAQLRDTDLQLRLKGLQADRERTQADLELADRELKRAGKLRKSNSISQKNHDQALFRHQALKQGLVKSEAEIAFLRYQIKQKKITAPFTGFIAEEHSQVGQWINSGGRVVTLLDLSQIRIEVSVPERYVINLAPGSPAWVTIKNLPTEHLPAKIRTILPQGDSNSRSFIVRIDMDNPGYSIRAGMEAEARFNLPATQKTLLIPKDAIVPAGNNNLVYAVLDGKALPFMVQILGYHDGNAAISGDLKPGMSVVVRGNERLRPGQSVAITES